MSSITINPGVINDLGGKTYDANGIIWPLSIAPYHVLVIPLQGKDPAVMELSQSIESSLTAAGPICLMSIRTILMKDCACAFGRRAKSRRSPVACWAST